jgi:putative DNA primase/helicase
LTNYPPTVQGSDYGIWRRLLLMSYEVKFGSAEDVQAGKATQLVDPTLPEALRSERQGIFAWIVQGAIEWYRIGLRPPQSILEETGSYQSEQDRVERFVADHCLKDQTAWVPNTDLHNAYRVWCVEHGYKALDWTKLTTELRRLVPHFEQDKEGRKVGAKGAGRKTVRGCYGLRLTETVSDPLDVFAQKADSAAPNNTVPFNEDLR